MARIGKEELHRAVVDGDTEAVRRLLDGISGAALNRKLPYDAGNYDPMTGVGDLGGTPLLLACAAGNLEIVRLLVAAGADLEVRDFTRQPPLTVAAVNDRADVARFLLDDGADPDAGGTNGARAIEAAVSVASPETIQVLIDNGADVHRVDSLGEPLLSALPVEGATSNLDVARLLLEQDLTPEHLTRGFYWAVRRGDVPLARLLAENGAGGGSQIAPGSELLFVVAGHDRQAPVVEYLMSLGEDFTAPGQFRPGSKTFKGSPLDYARELGNQPTVDLITG